MCHIKFYSSSLHVYRPRSISGIYQKLTLRYKVKAAPAPHSPGGWLSFDGRITRTMRYRGALAVQESDEAIIHHHMRSLCESLGNEPSQLGSIELMRSTEPLRGEPIPTTILALGDAAESEPERHVDQGQTLDDGVLVETALALENDDVNEEEYVFVNQDLAQYDDMQCAVTSAVRNGYPARPAIVRCVVVRCWIFVQQRRCCVEWTLPGQLDVRCVD